MTILWPLVYPHRNSFFFYFLTRFFFHFLLQLSFVSIRCFIGLVFYWSVVLLFSVTAASAVFCFAPHFFTSWIFRLILLDPRSWNWTLLNCLFINQAYYWTKAIWEQFVKQILSCREKFFDKLLKWEFWERKFIWSTSCGQPNKSLGWNKTLSQNKNYETLVEFISWKNDFGFLLQLSIVNRLLDNVGKMLTFTAEPVTRVYTIGCPIVLQ